MLSQVLGMRHAGWLASSGCSLVRATHSDRNDPALLRQLVDGARNQEGVVGADPDETYDVCPVVIAVQLESVYANATYMVTAGRQVTESVCRDCAPTS